MIDISADQIEAAAGGDAVAAEALIRAMDERIAQRAWRTDPDTAEDLAQEGRLALWLAIPRFEGASPAQFFAFADATLRGAMSDVRKESQRQQISRATAQRFEKCLRASGGDPMEAERKACADDGPLGYHKLSAELAELARLSWQGALSLEADAPFDSSAAWSVKGGGRANETGAARLTYADEVRRVSEEEKAATRAKVEAVRSTLDGLAPEFEAVLSAEFGIGDYALALGEDWDALADASGISRSAVESVEGAAREEFAKSYLGGEAERAPESGDVKQCKCCGVTKALDAFYVRNKATGARMATCKVCKRSAVVSRDSAQREAKNRRNREYRARKSAAAGGDA